MQTLSNDQLKRFAPSIFALEPWQEQSEHYRFIPTIQVIDALRDSGFYPVKAQQSRSRVPGKQEFTKHLLRFRQDGDYQVKDILPEIVLINSHDGTSSYQLSLGLFRLVCSNGLTVADSMLQSIRVTHRGLCQGVIDASFEVIADAPKALDTVNRWRSIELSTPEQTAMAETALGLYDSTIKVRPDQMLYARRKEDSAVNGGRSCMQ